MTGPGYLGDYKAGSTVDFAFDSTVNGLPSTLSSITVKAYKGSSSSTEITTGITVTADFDSLTGIVHVTIDLSSDGVFYAAGSDIIVTMTTATLGGNTVRSILAVFSIENRCVNWAKVAGATTVVNLSSTTVGIVTALANGGIIAATFAANALDAVWSTAARLLTAGTNIVLAKGTGVTGFNDLSSATVQTAADAAVTANAVVLAIEGKTNNIPASPAAVGSAMTLTSGERTSVADALLDRDMSLGADSGSTTVRTVRQALRFLRNLWTITGGTLTVKKEDDSTTSWTGAVTTTAGNPVSSIDPAGP